MTVYEIMRITAAIGGIGITLFLSSRIKRWARREQRRRACHV